MQVGRQHERHEVAAGELDIARIDAGRLTRSSTIPAIEDHAVVQNDRIAQAVCGNVVHQRIKFGADKAREKGRVGETVFHAAILSREIADSTFFWFDAIFLSVDSAQ